MKRLKLHILFALALLVLWFGYTFLLPVVFVNDALLDAARRGDDTKVQDLLNRGVYVDVIDGWSTTPLYYAAGNCRTSTVKLLLSNGAKIDYPSRMDRTALMIAAQAGCYETVTLLLHKEAEINHRDNQGDTAVTLAEKNNHLEVATLLKDHLAKRKEKTLQ